MWSGTLKLSNQLCFPLYAAAKSVVAKYTPYLEAINLTYTQYIVMMVLWERREVTVKELGEKLFLDSGTLTPLLKKLEHKGFVKRRRSAADERSVIVTITGSGGALREKAAEVPARMAGCMPLSQDEAGTLYKLLYKILEGGGRE
jgi:DNA-binding MarR family transcriptional regulator